MMYSNKDFLVLLATCQLTIGKSKNILINYANDNIYDITDEHVNILKLLRIRSIIDVEKELEDETSRDNYKEFIKFLLENEMAYVTSSPQLFPDISQEIHNDCTRLIDSIIEIHSTSDFDMVRKFCEEIADLDCKELQLWVVDNVEIKNICEVLDMTSMYGYSYVEIHSEHNVLGKDIELLRSIVEQYPNLKKVYLYAAQVSERIDVVNHYDNLAPLSLGEIILEKQSFEQGQSCGQIHFKSLDFSGYWVVNLNRKKNGCLYKKISLDRWGYIKNCPCMPINYGHISNTEIKNVITSNDYRMWGEIAKDEIEECKDCAYRYNCSDCRAFRCGANIYSKPEKCLYNPYTDCWK